MKFDPDQMHARGVAAMKSGDYETAVKTFAELCDVAPNSERLYYLGVLFDMIGAAPGAIGALKSSVTMDPLNSEALYSLAIIHAQAEDFDASYQVVRSAYVVAPDDYRIVNHYANMILRFSDRSDCDPAEALSLARRACELTEWEDEICKETYRLAEEANSEFG